MFQLNFKNQMILGFLIMIAGFVCATIFQQGTFYKLGVVIYGLLFVIHPVYPASITNPRMKLYIRLTALLVIVLALITRFGF